ncbi:MAG: peptidase C69 [Acidimicrobiales bacterium]|nr:MAG: peptidase C69 [Acidimicrobiales bacterium]
MRHIDPEFLALPLRRLADAALQAARDAGAEHADLRVERIRTQDLAVRDAELESFSDDDDLGLAVRVVVDGTWGFAAGVDLDTHTAADLAREAVEMARAVRQLNSEPVELAAEPAHGDVTWISAYDVDPFEVPAQGKVEQLSEWSRQLLASSGIDHVDASLSQVRENKFYADLAGTITTQQRVRIYPCLTAVSVDGASGRFDSMRTLAPPVGRGYEYLGGTGWDWTSELAELPDLLAQKMVAASVEPGRYDLVIDPSNLWLTIHESVGHATELDRALGYEASYAGTSFATPDQLGRLRYGSDLMAVTGDRTVDHGLASVGWDDEGVKAQRWDLVRDGTLVGYQLDRGIAGRVGADRSNGCAFADSARHVPLQRMANVSLAPGRDGATTEDLIAGVDRGIYIVGNKSWSIDMQRYNFQFTGQRFYAIRAGRLDGQLRDVAYQSTTTDFWGSLGRLGGEATWVLGGAFNCGKAQPGQVAPVSHGCPSALFSNIAVLNTVEEAGA